MRRLPALLLLLLFAACGDDPQAPSIEAVLPDHGKPGELVEVVGERFEGTERQVSFGGESASVVLWQARRARVVVPQRQGGVTNLVVTVDGMPSKPVAFYVD